MSQTVEVKTEMDVDTTTTTTRSSKSGDEYANSSPEEIFDLMRVEFNAHTKSQRNLSRLATALFKAHRKQRAILLQGRKQPQHESTSDKPKRKTAFEYPVPISEALCKFLGKPPGSTETRIAVTRAINAYIKKNNLNEGRIINVDPVLETLIGSEKEWKSKLEERKQELMLSDQEKAKNYDTQNVTYFNMTRLNRHNFLATNASTSSSSA